MGENWLDWLCYLAGNFQTAFFIFSGYFSFNDFIMNQQTKNARAFLPLNISAVGGVTLTHTYALHREHKELSFGNMTNNN